MRMASHAVSSVYSVTCRGRACRSVVVKKDKHKANYGKDPDNKENILNHNFKAETIN